MRITFTRKELRALLRLDGWAQALALEELFRKPTDPPSKVDMAKARVLVDSGLFHFQGKVVVPSVLRSIGSEMVKKARTRIRTEREELSASELCKRFADTYRKRVECAYGSVLKSDLVLMAGMIKSFGTANVIIAMNHYLQYYADYWPERTAPTIKLMYQNMRTIMKNVKDKTTAAKEMKPTNKEVSEW